MNSKELIVLYLVFAVSIAFTSSTLVYGATAQNLPGKQITFVGKMNVPDLPKHQVSSNKYIKIFLPKDPVSFHLDKSKAEFMHVVKNMSSLSTGMNPRSYESIPSRIMGGFDGLNQTQCDCVPPDVQVATGPNDVVEMVNADMGIWSKNGTSVSTLLLGRLFSIPDSDIISDPRIMFDASSKRWYSSILDVTTSQVGIAVSVTDDPSQSWNVYSIQFDGNCPDQPSIGMSSDKFVVSANDFTSCVTNPSFVGAQYFVINKSDLILGVPHPAMQKFGPDGSAFTIFPVQSLDSSPTLFMASAYGTNNVLQLYSISGSVPNIRVTYKDLVIQTLSMPPNALQRNTTSVVDTTDDRIQSAVSRGGNIWLGLNDGCTPQGDVVTRSCVRLVELDVARSSVLQDFDIGYAGFYYFYPALTVDSLSRLNLEFGYSSPSDYPGLMYAIQDLGVGLNGIEKPEVFKQGSWYDATGRYGDYFGAASDPSDTAYAWFAGEYHNAMSPSWSTFVATTDPAAIPEFPYSELVMIIAVSMFIVFAGLKNKFFGYGEV